MRDVFIFYEIGATKNYYIDKYNYYHVNGNLTINFFVMNGVQFIKSLPGAILTSSVATIALFTALCLLILFKLNLIVNCKRGFRRTLSFPTKVFEALLQQIISRLQESLSNCL